MIPTEWQNGEIDGTTWHELLRSFIGVKELYIDDALLEELSRALQVDEVGLDPGFLPNLQSIHADDNLFTSFIDSRQVVGRPVQFVMEYVVVAAVVAAWSSTVLNQSVRCYLNSNQLV